MMSWGCSILCSSKRAERRRDNTGGVHHQGVNFFGEYGKLYKVSKGDLLYGKEQVTLEDSMMTCACSVKRWELEQKKVLDGEETEGRNDVSLHCQEDGSYETLQCDNGMCWCVEQRRGNYTLLI